MSEQTSRVEDATIVPFWVFFARGTKWMGSFVGGCLAYYLTGIVTPDPVWISILTFSTAFVGWSTGTFLDINTYLNQRLSDRKLGYKASAAE